MDIAQKWDRICELIATGRRGRLHRGGIPPFRWERERMTVAEKFANYGRDYVDFFIRDYDRLNEWKGINFREFQQALVNANAPAFDPEVDLRLDDPDGKLYDLAVSAAWAQLSLRLAEEDY